MAGSQTPGSDETMSSLWAEICLLDTAGQLTPGATEQPLLSPSHPYPQTSTALEVRVPGSARTTRDASHLGLSTRPKFTKWKVAPTHSWVPGIQRSAGHGDHRPSLGHLHRPTAAPWPGLPSHGSC